jgi:subtilase family serine protease
MARVPVAAVPAARGLIFMALALPCQWVWAAASPTPRVALPIDETRRIELTGQVHRAVRSSVDLGPADEATAAERIVMVLAGSGQQQADLDQFLTQVQTRGHPDFHHWLTPQEFAARFGVAASDRRAIRAWLESHGFRIDEEPAGGRSIVFSGTVGQLNEAFRAHIHRYRWRGEAHLANAVNPTLPAAFAGVIAGFASLHDFRLRSQLLRAAAPAYTSASGTHYLAPGDFATIYDLTPTYSSGITGSGRSIAVLGRSDIVMTDLSNFRAAFGSAQTPSIIVNGTDPGLVSGDETESDLDLEWAGAIAPGAAVKFVTSKSTALTDGISLSAQYAVSNNLADVITVSYSGCESPADVSGGTTFFNQLWQQAAAQGTAVFASSGDSGAAGCDAPTETTAVDGAAVNALCTSAYSTCVGGTALSADVANPSAYWRSANTPGTQASAISYIGEAVWNESGTDLYATGGGASIYMAKPAWQLTTGVPSDGHRDVPDLSLSAAAGHDPYLIYTSDGQSGSTLGAVGGTSAAAPSMAGIAALVAQSQHGRTGSFNPVLYGLSGRQVAGGPAVFHRITSGNNSVPGQTGFSASTADSTFNEATGLGSIDAAQLITYWNDYPGFAELTPSSAVVPASATVGSATLILAAGTAWNAVVGGGESWLSVTPASGTGSAPLTYAAAANTKAAARSGTITVAGQVLTVTQAAASAGGTNSSQLNLSATTINVGTDTVGTPAVSQLLIADSGNASLTLGTLTLGGTGSAAFSDSGSCAAGMVLVPGAVCYLDVTFDPSALGTDSASLQIDLGGTPAASVSLSGTGVAAEPVDSDGPLPAWAYAMLAIVLLAIGARARSGGRTIS